MRKINERIVHAIAESLGEGAAGTLELKRRIDKRLNRVLPLDTFYRYKRISGGLGIINSKAEAKKVRGGYQTVHSLTERAKKNIALGFNLLDITKYRYHKNNNEIVSVGDWSDNDDAYRLFLIMASIDTIESAQVEEIYERDENKMLERVRALVPTISMKDLVIAGKEKRIDGCVATYYRPVSCLQIWKEEYPSTMIMKGRENKKRTVRKNIITKSKPAQDCEQQEEQTVVSDVSITKRNITFYHVQVLGASASDIVRYNKDKSKRSPKFSGITTHPISLKKAQKVLSTLQRDQLIAPIGKLRGETRFTIKYSEVQGFIGDCLIIQGQIIDLMNKLWQYRIRKVNRRDRRWLEMIYGHRKADRIISNNLAFLDDDLPRFIDERLSTQQELLPCSSDPTSSSRGSGNYNNRKAAIRAEIEESQRQVEQDAEIFGRHIRKEIQDMQLRYANTFKEYRFPLERIMQLLTLPYFDSTKVR